MLPTARRDGLKVHELDGETVIYDSTREISHCLSADAWLVWNLCDGRTTADQMIQALALNSQGEGKHDSRSVALILASLANAGLLQQPVPLATNDSTHGSTISKRDFLRQMAVSVALATTPVMSLVLPRESDADSFVSQKSHGYSVTSASDFEDWLLQDKKESINRPAAHSSTPEPRTTSGDNTREDTEIDLGEWVLSKKPT